MRVRQRFGYLHVPKAAGSSVTDAIRRAISKVDEEEGTTPNLCPLQFDATLFGDFDVSVLPEPFRSLVLVGPVDELASYDVVIGHFSAPALSAGREPGDLVTLLREPRSKLLSLYTFWRSWSPAEHDAWEPYEASQHAVSQDWSQFLDDPVIASQTDNVAARMLLGDHPLIPIDGFIDESNVDAVARDAVATLNEFGHADVIENDSDCWARLGHWTGLDLDIQRRNTTEVNQGPSADWTRAWDGPAWMAFHRRTRIDLQLWVAAAGRHASASELDRLGERAGSIATKRFEEVTRETDLFSPGEQKEARFRRASAALRRAAGRLPGR